MTAAKTILKSILDHPDREEIINKILLDISENDIHEWLEAKYSGISEKKFIISKKNLELFKENYLDIYSILQEDIGKVKKNLVKASNEEELKLALDSNPTYKSLMLKAATTEVDIKKTVISLCALIENRMGAMFDQIQEDPNSINTRSERVLMEWIRVMGEQLQFLYKVTEEPKNSATIQNTYNIEVTNSYISVIQDSIKETLASMDLEASFQFMEILNDKMLKLKQPGTDSQFNMSQEAKLAEVKIINEVINKKIN